MQITLVKLRQTTGSSRLIITPTRIISRDPLAYSKIRRFTPLLADANRTGVYMLATT